MYCYNIYYVYIHTDQFLGANWSSKTQDFPRVYRKVNVILIQNHAKSRYFGGNEKL
jgi:hypothetical protein